MKIAKSNMKLTDNTLDRQPCYLDATEDIHVLKNPHCVDLFDQNGYHLTEAEQAYLNYNGYDTRIRRPYELTLRQDWITSDKRSGAHINHSDLFERKGFSSNALDQLHAVAEFHNPMLYKLINMKPKWGIDISIDYVSLEKTFEVFHYEWDGFYYDHVIERKEEVEKLVLKLDWEEVAIDIWDLRGEWHHLDFFAQSKWRTDYFGLPPERFKNVIWDS
jgi:hypothetical protein